MHRIMARPLLLRRCQESGLRDYILPSAPPPPRAPPKNPGSTPEYAYEDNPGGREAGPGGL